MPLKVTFVHISKIKKPKICMKKSTTEKKRRTAMNGKIWVCATYVEAIIYLLLYNLHDFTFKNGQKRKPLKRSDLFKNLIVVFSIVLYMLQLKSSGPYERIFKSFSLE